MTEKERQLRQGADFTSFLKDVMANSKQTCLCQNNEYAIYSFSTKNNKTASLSISKNASTTQGYLVYRFGTKNKIEMTFPTHTLNSFSKFTYAEYHRGGGKQNAAMSINSLRFTNNDFTYTLYENWSSEDDRYQKGIDVTSNNTGKTAFLEAKGKVTGTLYSFRNRNIVTPSNEL
jgi:hypothetical protein